MHVTIDEVAIPSSLDDGSAGAAFIEMTHVRNAVEAAVVGSDDLAPTPPELLAGWLNAYEPRRLFVARVEGTIVGRGVYEVQLEEGVASAWLTVEVLPSHRQHGIGEALHERLIQLARHEGRTIVQVFAMHRADAGGDTLPSPTGFGAVPSGDAGARFLLARGYRLAQVERMSRLDLPVRVIVPDAPEGYELEKWDGPTPAHRLDDLAALHAQMSTDAPAGDLDVTPEIWDGDRVLAADERELGGGRRLLTAAVRHRASDTLVGFTQLSVPPEQERPINQNDTIVASGHRGHRLGMFLKAANLARLETEAPGHPSVYTWNAEENRHMLRVNEAVGFVAVGLEGGWRREL